MQRILELQVFRPGIYRGEGIGSDRNDRQGDPFEKSMPIHKLIAGFQGLLLTEPIRLVAQCALSNFIGLRIMVFGTCKRPVSGIGIVRRDDIVNGVIQGADRGDPGFGGIFLQVVQAIAGYIPF
ncbi:hypothetical protein D3C80_1282910 [compost metagenome]